MLRAALPIAVAALAACVPPIPDRPPSMPGVSLGPEALTTREDLVLTLETASESYTERVVTYTVTWLQDGEAVAEVEDAFSDGDFEILQAEYTSKSERWTAEVVANDGGPDSVAGVAGRNIRNTPPSVSTAWVNPQEAFETSTLICEPLDWTDPDEDEQSTTISWTVDGVAVSENGSLAGDLFNRDQEVFCTLTPWDGEETGEPVQSGTITIGNTAPQATSASLSTTSPAETDTLSVTVAGAVDDDGDAITYLTSWFVDGSLSAQTGTINGDLFSKGQTVYVEVTPTDGTDAGSVVTSDTATVVNTPPVLDSVALTPSMAATTGDFTCTEGSSSDADGDTLVFAYEWSVDGLVVSETSSVLSAVGLSEGASVSCSVTPGDGEEDGAAVSSDFGYVNYRPAVSNVEVYPNTATAATTYFTCSHWSPTDLDGGSPILAYVWTVDSGTVGGDSKYLTRTMIRDEVLSCTATPSDNLESGDPVVSPLLTIANSVPTVDSVTLSPSAPTTNQVVTATVASTDLDSDTVTYTYEWYVAGGLIFGNNQPTLDGATYFSLSEAVQVMVSPYDGHVSGSPAWALVTVANTLPTAPGISLTPASPTTDDNLVCAVDTPATDDDTSQTLTYYYDWKVDGQYFTGTLTEASDNLSQTVASADTSGGEEWECMVTASDGLEYGPSVTASVDLPATHSLLDDFNRANSTDVEHNWEESGTRDWFIEGNELKATGDGGSRWASILREVGWLETFDVTVKTYSQGGEPALVVNGFPTYGNDMWVGGGFLLTYKGSGQLELMRGDADVDDGAYDTTLDTFVYTMSQGTWYHMRLVFDGTTLSANVWEDGQTEPSTFMLSAAAEEVPETDNARSIALSSDHPVAIYFDDIYLTSPGLDQDEDGYSFAEDCNDSDDTLFPYDSDGDGVEDSCGWKQLALGVYHTCAIDSAGEIQCWGMDETSHNQSSPPSGAFTQISTSLHHGCGVTEDSYIECWGVTNSNDNYGQVNEAPTDNGYIEVTAGERHSCALDSSGVVTCWGAGHGERTGSCFASSGAHGSGYDYDCGQSTPVSGTYSQVSAGRFHTCGLVAGTGAISCWGNDDEYQVTDTPTDTGFTSISSGGRFTCAINSVDGIECWGLNDNGQSNPNSGIFQQVHAGDKFACGIDSDGEIQCWGHDNSSFPQLDAPSGTFSLLGTGSNHGCAVDDTDGDLTCWGRNDWYQLCMINDGLSESCPSTTCQTILEDGYSEGDGSYWIDPDGNGALEVYCDMTTEGGGWTQVLYHAATQNSRPCSQSADVGTLATSGFASGLSTACLAVDTIDYIWGGGHELLAVNDNYSVLSTFDDTNDAECKGRFLTMLHSDHGAGGWTISAPDPYCGSIESLNGNNSGDLAVFGSDWPSVGGGHIGGEFDGFVLVQVGGTGSANWAQGGSDLRGDFGSVLSDDAAFFVREASSVCTDGSSSACAAESCLAILEDGDSVGDETYWIDPDGTGAFEAYCDMTTDDGGWTLVVGIDGGNKNHVSTSEVTSSNLVQASSLWDTGKGKFSDSVIQELVTEAYRMNTDSSTKAYWEYDPGQLFEASLTSVTTLQIKPGWASAWETQPSPHWDHRVLDTMESANSADWVCPASFTSGCAVYTTAGVSTGACDGLSWGHHGALWVR